MHCKKSFVVPRCDIIKFTVEDILTTSSDGWDIGDQSVVSDIQAVEAP